MIAFTALVCAPFPIRTNDTGDFISHERQKRQR
jgi:hypothetical protein